MPSPTFARPALAAALLAALTAGAGAATGAADIPIEQASTAYLEVLRSAVQPGWTEGQFTAWNDAGVQTETNSKPQCVTPERQNELPDSFAEMFQSVGTPQSCKVTAYEPGTLRYAISCAKEGKTFTFDSSGTFGPDAIDLTIKLKATGDNAPDLGSMHMVGKRTRACTAAETAAALTEGADKGAE